MGWRSKNVVIAMIVVALLAIALVRTHGGASTNVVRNIPPSVQTAPTLVAVASQSLLGDADKDGLPDWEETLRKTDINNPDSDGDGIPDGKETFEDSTIDTRVEKVVRELDAEGLTATERFGRELLLQYLATKREGGVFDTRSTEKFAKKFATEVDQAASIVLYGAKDIQTIAANNPVAFKEYANRLGRIIVRNTPPGLENEIVVATRALENEDPEELRKIQPLVESFSNSIAEGLSVPVPSELAALHLDLLNSFVYMKTTLAGLQLIFDDPLTAFIRISQHQESGGKLRVALGNISSFYTNANIQFGSDDEGLVLMQFE